MAAGLNAVFELGPCFRRDAPTALRHPEFYMLELFKANVGFQTLLELTKDLLIAATQVELSDIAQVSVWDWLARECKCPQNVSETEFRHALLQRWPSLAEMTDRPLYQLVEEAVDHWLRPHLRGTTVLTEYPTCTICLARRRPESPHLIERFELYVEQVEVAHGFIDEMCPVDVESRMRANGEHFMDHRFLELLRTSALPASGGVGFGIERMLVALCGGGAVNEYIHENQFIAYSRSDARDTPQSGPLT